MVVLAVAAVVVTIGVPSFKSMMVTNDLSSVANDLTMSLKLARSSAITSGRPAYVCSSDDGSTCKNQDGFWAKGWLVWVDLDGSNTFNPSATNNELLWVKEIDPNTQITITPVNSFGKNVRYKYTGTIFNAVAGSFQLCSGFGADGYPRRVISLTATGEPQFSKELAIKC